MPNTVAVQHKHLRRANITLSIQHCIMTEKITNSHNPNEECLEINGHKLSVEEYLNQDEKKDLLRLLTAGSVDDGKSTLIGRLLFDSKKLYEDQLSALERDSQRVGNAGAGQIDYALLCDGLKAEREQGITIDVAYRYFSTNKRKFIIADTPGHEQYTRNMITGGSTANLAMRIYAMTKKRISPKVNAVSTLLFVTVLTLLIVINVREARQEKAQRQHAQ